MKSFLGPWRPKGEGQNVTDREARALRTMTRIIWIAAPILIALYLWWRASP